MHACIHVVYIHDCMHTSVLDLLCRVLDADPDSNWACFNDSVDYKTMIAPRELMMLKILEKSVFLSICLSDYWFFIDLFCPSFCM